MFYKESTLPESLLLSWKITGFYGDLAFPPTGADGGISIKSWVKLSQRSRNYR